MKKSTGLNDYHQQQSTRLSKKVSEQPLLSSEEFTEQVRRLSSQSQRAKTNVGQSAN